MSQSLTNLRDIEFLLHDVFDVSGLSGRYEQFEVYNKKARISLGSCQYLIACGM